MDRDEKRLYDRLDVIEGQVRLNRILLCVLIAIAVFGAAGINTALGFAQLGLLVAVPIWLGFYLLDRLFLRPRRESRESEMEMRLEAEAERLRAES
jgi:hypothetical protein